MHIPVLLKEVIENLNPKSGENFIDATLDGGGHARVILEKNAPDGKLLGIDWDGKLVELFKNSLTENNLSRSVLVNDSYVNISEIIERENFKNIAGILFDLGMSNWHIEESGRGFSFLRDEPIDMRFDPLANSLTAREVVNGYSREDLIGILKDYGEERFAIGIADGIMNARKQKSINTTIELVEIIKNAVPFWYRRGKRHFATKSFQAIRIEVNGEIENIKKSLVQAIKVLQSGGRLAVITFHSLEDRTVKNLFKEAVKEGTIELVHKKPIVPTLIEITANPKARSAKLRTIQKI